MSGLPRQPDQKLHDQRLRIATARSIRADVAAFGTTADVVAVIDAYIRLLVAHEQALQTVAQALQADEE